MPTNNYRIAGIAGVPLLVAALAVAYSLLAPGRVREANAPATPIAKKVALDDKRIVWIDSYHQNYAWSDGVEQGIRCGLKDTGIEIKTLRLDAKQHPAEDTIRQNALRIKEEITAFKPDAIIASDDHAQK